VAFDWASLKDAYKSFVDTIVIELCLPGSEFPTYILTAMLSEAFDEQPKEKKRFPQALFDTLGDLSVCTYSGLSNTRVQTTIDYRKLHGSLTSLTPRSLLCVNWASDSRPSLATRPRSIRHGSTPKWTRSVSSTRSWMTSSSLYSRSSKRRARMSLMPYGAALIT
jgi:hypothetical protein